MLNDTYWNRYTNALDNNMISVEGLEVCQNIQDVCYNLTKFKAAQDNLLKSTTYISMNLMSFTIAMLMMSLQYILMRLQICLHCKMIMESDKFTPLKEV